MLSYAFRNKKLKREDILKILNEEFTFKTLRDSSRAVLLTNNLLTVMIDNKYTRIILSNESVNIERIEDFF